MASDLNGPQVIACATLIVTFLTLAAKSRAIRDALVRLYKNPRITAHLTMPGYVLSMRMVFGAVAVLLAAPLALTLRDIVSALR